MAILHSNNSSQLALNSQTTKPSCQLVTGLNTGNTLLKLSSGIADKIKKKLENSDGTLKYSLQCTNVF
jgi:hypothetical protein